MPAAASARCGTEKRGLTCASTGGRSRSRAMASTVREMPATSASSAPEAAATAPMVTTTAQTPPAPTASSAARKGAGPQPCSPGAGPTSTRITDSTR